MAKRTQKLTFWLKGAERVILRASDIAKYTFTYPWRDIYFGIKRTKAEPERYLDRWIGVRQAEYSFIGLVGSVVSAVVAQMLQLPQLADSPWTASAALYISVTLSLMAVVTALHHTLFLNSTGFQPSLDAQLQRVFGLQVARDVDTTRQHEGVGIRWWHASTRSFLFSIPQILLSYSIICSFVGMGLIAVSPLWGCSDRTWDGPQKTACASIAGLGIGVTAYFGGVICQYPGKTQENSAE